MSMLNPEDKAASEEATGGATKARKRFQLPKLGRKKEGADPVVDSRFAVGSSASNDPTDPFSQAFEIKDEIGPIPSEKEMRKSKKGKSPISLGAKYGGQRKIFALLAAALIGSLLFNLLLFVMVTRKVDASALDKKVKASIANSTAKNFPVGQAGMWLESFVRIYGTWDYKTPGARAADLSPYLAQGMDPQAGWDTKGSQRLIYSSVSSQPVIEGNRAVFDFTYQIQDGTWRCAKVPVFAYKPTDSKQGPTDQWGFAITANPTPVPCALRVSVPDFAGNKFKKKDQNAAATLKETFFPGFFTAWVGSDADTLRQYMAPDVKSFGLGGAYQSKVVINEVTLPIGDAEEKAQPNTKYSAYVNVTLMDFSDSKLTATYKVPVSSNGSQWQVVGEPEAIVQELEGITHDLPESAGKNTKGEGADTNNEYSEPEQVQPSQLKDQNATVPSAVPSATR